MKKQKEKMYHYTDCGLTTVWLVNGFDTKETAYGPATAIHNLEGLHKAIGMQLAQFKPRLTGPEVRFLRKEMNLSQNELAAALGVIESSLRNWESNRNTISKPAERLLRGAYIEMITGDGQLRRLLDRLSEMGRDVHKTNAKKQTNKLELEESTDGNWLAAAA